MIWLFNWDWNEKPSFYIRNWSMGIKYRLLGRKTPFPTIPELDGIKFMPWAFICLMELVAGNLNCGSLAGKSSSQQEPKGEAMPWRDGGNDRKKKEWGQRVRGKRNIYINKVWGMLVGRLLVVKQSIVSLNSTGFYFVLSLDKQRWIHIYLNTLRWRWVLKKVGPIGFVSE